MRSLELHAPSAEAEVVFPIIRRLYALLALGVGGLWWLGANLQLQESLMLLAPLSLLVAALALGTVRRVDARYRLSETALTGRDFGWTGPRSIDLAYSQIRGIGFSRLEVLPDLIVWRQEGPALRLPGLMFSGSRDFADRLRERVAKSNGTARDALMLPANFRRKALGFLLPVLSVLGGGMGAFQVLQSGVWPEPWKGLGLVLLLAYAPLCALLGAAPFVSYRGEGRRIHRRVWLRPSLSRTIDLDRASSYWISPGRMPRLRLFTRNGSELASLELDDFDFDDVVFWAEKKLRKSR
ncbi:MAG TPA: hypothetical protein VEU33_34050 [Archangium sp.]|nr:hypothetical protein [Archangium sp.]